MRIVSTAMVLGVVGLGLAGFGNLMAATVVNTDTFVYTLHLPDVTGGVENDQTITEYQFSWVGPLKFNAAPDSLCPTVCGAVDGGSVAARETFDHFSVISSGSDAVLDVLFSDFSAVEFANSNTVTFRFIEPDSFWAATGSVPFPTDGSASFVIGTAPVQVQGLQAGSSDTAGITCNGCSVDVADTAATPEPNTSALFAGALGALMFLMRKRLRTA
jgi:hypothetical protein